VAERKQRITRPSITPRNKIAGRAGTTMRRAIAPLPTTGKQPLKISGSRLPTPPLYTGKAPLKVPARAPARPPITTTGKAPLRVPARRTSR
jgi:hypothetical protein